MNWAVWGPVLGTFGAAFLALIGLVFQTRKNHHIALETIDSVKKQSDAAVKSADAALEAARASTKTAEATAAAAIQNAITKAIEANDKRWAIYGDMMERRCKSLEEEVSNNAARIDAAELRALADKERADRWEDLYSKAKIYLRKLIRWIDDTVPGEAYPPIPPELKMDL